MPHINDLEYRCVRRVHCCLFLLAALIVGVWFPIRAGAQASAPIAPHQQAFNKGESAYLRGHYRRAMSSWKTAAAGGNAKAMNQIGYLYNKGLGVTKDYRKAADWYTRAAAAGEFQAMYNLGLCYQLGQGRKQNYGLAIKWYRRAAAGGVARAMYAIGRLYTLGHGLHKSTIDAIKWFRKAANAGNKDAMLYLYAAYKKGWGVSHDRAKAKKWLERASIRNFNTNFWAILSSFIFANSHTRVIKNGFDDRPCKVISKTFRIKDKLDSIAVCILSHEGISVLSESPAGVRFPSPGIIALEVLPHGSVQTIPLVMVNGKWQLLGNLGPGAFRYKGKIYHYDKAKDIWVPVKGQAQSPNP